MACIKLNGSKESKLNIVVVDQKIIFTIISDTLKSKKLEESFGKGLVIMLGSKFDRFTVVERGGSVNVTNLKSLEETMSEWFA